MIIKLEHYADELKAITKKGLPQGMDLGWLSLKAHYRPDRGYMTVVTGIPGHGKSEFIDAAMVNLADMHDWKFAIYSPENYPIALHAIKLVEKYLGMSHKKISMTTFADAHAWVDKHFSFIYPEDDQSTLPRILEFVKEIQGAYGCDGFVIDPWNEIDHLRAESLSETEYISASLTKIRRFSRENRVHSWIVSHPTKLRKNDANGYDCPSLYDISGSAHWRNKTDFGVVIHRPNMMENKMQVHVQKVKQKNFGKLGMVEFDYNFESGRLVECIDAPYA